MKFKLAINEKELIVELNNWAERANGSALVRLGDTVVLATAVMSKAESESRGFFPLTVEYLERYYAAGKILGSRFVRRESRPTDEAILTARLIDRGVRPRFPENFGREVQIIVTCLSWDRENDPDVLGFIAASLALGVSDIPWSGPLAILRIGKIDKEFILNPAYAQRESAELELTLTGLKNKQGFLINMLEAEGQEVAEETILEAFKFAKPYLEKIIAFQEQIIKKSGKKKIDLVEKSPEPELESEIKKFLGKRLEEALYSGEETGKTDKIKEELLLFIKEKHPEKINFALNFFEQTLTGIFRENILNQDKRPDGRKLKEIRKISCQVGVLPRTHGSAIFERGETKSLSILTLGGPDNVKLLEGMEFCGKKRFMHHYNFPPYSVGEVKFLRAPGRREIGHGMLAERALFPLIPDFEKFPYTLRIVSEILSSNGSTSMASVCSSSLALMDAGVPIKNPVAGISLGLVKKDEKNFKLLTDIQGPEDSYGDMDFKLAGTKKGITAMQMDVKIDGINEEILKETLEQAKEARLEILEKLEETLEKPRPNLSPLAPKIFIIQINPEKIGKVIGSEGKTIKQIIEECQVSIDVEDDGKVFITAEKEVSAQKAMAWIKNITKEIKVGETFRGKVRRILGFGAMVEIAPGQDGLIHISQLAPYRVKRVEDIVNLGDVVPVKVISIDEQGRVNLSLEEVSPESKNQS
ncbi:polyribonucleotide nucleotidyltransferase [Patescibacteria group bacterium]|nr:polyribonucleotide nucleotidyltransferase [Patescibacteria group bacterium]